MDDTRDRFLAEVRAILAADPENGAARILEALHKAQRDGLEARQEKAAAVLEAIALTAEAPERRG